MFGGDMLPLVDAPVGVASRSLLQPSTQSIQPSYTVVQANRDDVFPGVGDSEIIYNPSTLSSNDVIRNGDVGLLNIDKVTITVGNKKYFHKKGAALRFVETEQGPYVAFVGKPTEQGLLSKLFNTSTGGKRTRRNRRVKKSKKSIKAKKTRGTKRTNRRSSRRRN
jgi:hypothetical protein